MQTLKQLEFANVSALSPNIFYVTTTDRIILDLNMSKELIDTCAEMTNNQTVIIGLILNLSKAVFVTEEARDYITEVGTQKCNMVSLAIVSDNHHGNIVSTLMISFSNQEKLPMQLFKTLADATYWIRTRLENVKMGLLKTA